MQAKLPHRAERTQLPGPGVTPVQHPATWLWASALSRFLSGRFGQGGGGTRGWQGSAPAATNPAHLCSFSTAHLGERRVQSCQGIFGMVLWDGSFPELWKPPPEMPPSRRTWEKFTALQFRVFLFFSLDFYNKASTETARMLAPEQLSSGSDGPQFADAFGSGCRSTIQPSPSNVCLSTHPHSPACWIHHSWMCSVILQCEFPPAPVLCAGMCPHECFGRSRHGQRMGFVDVQLF